MAIVDRHGLPLACSTHAANHHEVTLIQLSFDFYMIEANPDNLIGDRACDSDKLDEELRQDGIDMIAPHRRNGSNRGLKTAAVCVAMNGVFRWNGSLPGFSGNVVSWFVGNITPRIFPASCNSQPSLSCQSNFEIGSAHFRLTWS